MAWVDHRFYLLLCSIPLSLSVSGEGEGKEGRTEEARVGFVRWYAYTQNRDQLNENLCFRRVRWLILLNFLWVIRGMQVVKRVTKTSSRRP